VSRNDLLAKPTQSQGALASRTSYSVSFQTTLRVIWSSLLIFQIEKLRSQRGDYGLPKVKSQPMPELKGRLLQKALSALSMALCSTLILAFQSS
jgi:hypothetical protein